MARAIDSSRRSMPFHEWPEGDQNAWTQAVVKGDPFEDEGPAAHWAERTQQTNIQHYGRWLGWLDWSGLLDADKPPADRVNLDCVRRYNQHLESIDISPITRLSMLVGLKEVVRAMVPDRSWRWLQDICNRIQRTAKPRTDKRAKMRSTQEIYSAAIGVLEKCNTEHLTAHSAVAYRDALMVALMATRPLRTKNFTSLELGRHLVPVDGQWLMNIPAKEVKNRRHIEFWLPELLLPWFERYLAEIRPFFPNPENSPRLWLGLKGPLGGSCCTYQRITLLTNKFFGTPINPHLFRDCAASSMAMESPDLVQAATPLLGHGHRSTTEKYYIQADNLDASRRVNAILDTIKADSGECS